MSNEWSAGLKCHFLIIYLERMCYFWLVAQRHNITRYRLVRKHRFQPNHLYTVGPREDWTQDWCAASLTAIYIYIPVYVLCHAFRKNFIATARFKQYTVVARTFVLCTIGLKVAYFIRCINSILNIYLLFQVLY